MLWFPLFWVFAVYIDNHAHVGGVVFGLFGKERDLYFEQVVAEFSQFAHDNCGGAHGASLNKSVELLAGG